jgi:hypothetical protein
MVFPDSLSGKAPVGVSQEADSLAGFLNFFSQNYVYTTDKVIDLFIPLTGDPYTFQVLPGNPAATEYRLASISEVFDDTIPTLAPPQGATISSSGEFSWKPTTADIGKDYYFDVQTIANDGDNSIFDTTPLDLVNSVAIRAHVYNPIGPVTPETQIVFIPYEGTENQTVPGSGTGQTVSTSSFTVANILTGTELFSDNPNQTVPITITDTSVIIVLPRSQIDSAVQSLSQDLSVYVTDPVTATPTHVPNTYNMHTSFDADFVTTVTPDVVDPPVNLVGNFFFN